MNRIKVLVLGNFDKCVLVRVSLILNLFESNEFLTIWFEFGERFQEIFEIEM